MGLSLGMGREMEEGTKGMVQLERLKLFRDLCLMLLRCTLLEVTLSPCCSWAWCQPHHTHLDRWLLLCSGNHLLWSHSPAKLTLRC